MVDLTSRPILTAGLATIAGGLAGFVVASVLGTVLGRLAPKHAVTLRRLLRMPATIATPLLVVKVMDPDASWAGPFHEPAAHGQHVALIIAIAWLLLRLISAAELLLVDRLGTLDASASASRKARTQIAL